MNILDDLKSPLSHTVKTIQFPKIDFILEVRIFSGNFVEGTVYTALHCNWATAISIASASSHINYEMRESKLISKCM